jgi:hypothetical protein
MSMLHPPQRIVPLVVFTPSGYIKGNCHISVALSLRSFLNSGEEILKLTDAVLPGSSDSHPFLALQKSAALLVVPGSPDKEVGSNRIPRSQEGRLTTCLLSLGSIRGWMEVPEAVRTSDFLSRNPWFLAFHDCHIGPNPYMEPKDFEGKSIPLVLVNSRSLVGISEEIPSATQSRQSGSPSEVYAQ